ncbi:MAG: bifunctional anthranilate synthase component I family protein/class IV aminotransferase [Leptospiraceae bacterium]|nr:bifunctional anthranilate synthase component I family protein/class IV aminotransferase [Leptospiraceae bacterium]
MIRFLFYGQEGQSSRFLRAYFRPIQSLRLNADQFVTSDRPLRQRIIQNLQTIDQWKQDFHVVCLFSYEMGCILQDANMPAPLPGGYPLMAAYAFTEVAEEPMQQTESESALCPAFALGPARALSSENYRSNIQAIQEAILSGRTYQVNFTQPLQMPFSGNPLALFNHLRRRFPSPYSVYAELEDRHIISISPELFFSCKPAAPSRSSQSGDHRYRIEVRPMKGTVRAASNPEENQKLMQQLLESEKDRAELAMITDLLRNDLGRICAPGHVRLEKAIQPESYVYVHQLTSMISGERANDRLEEIIPSLFPSGSITGAPRRETMQIIAERESEYRGIYTGSIGYCWPSRKKKTSAPMGNDGQIDSPLSENDSSSGESGMVFNVAIRTAEIAGAMLRYGAGGGITLMSQPDLEWKELHWKARPVLAQKKPGLIETMALKNGKIRNEALHVRRLMRSARKFAILLAEETIKRNLQRLKTDRPRGNFRVRLHLSANGELEESVVPMPAKPSNSKDRPSRLEDSNALLQTSEKRPGRKKWKLKLIQDPVSSRDPWLLHKVDRREIYDRTLDSVRQAGYDEAVFINENQEITEGAISSIFYRVNGSWYAPPVRCGLLPGVGRERLLAKWREKIGFRRLKVHELNQVERIVLVNSLRGLHEGEMAP